jgi:hypothetical protein
MEMMMVMIMVLMMMWRMIIIIIRMIIYYLLLFGASSLTEVQCHSQLGWKEDQHHTALSMAFITLLLSVRPSSDVVGGCKM